MDNICLAILWHQHQPSYQARFGTPASMPWARLHGIKDYVGMALLARRFPAFHHTINLVPCLLDQVEGLAAEDATDVDLELTRKPAEDLTEDDAREVLDRFFAANIDTMIRPHPRYAELLEKRRLNKRTAADALGDFGAGDLRDLQVWHTLAWFHPLVVEEREDVRGLLAKGAGYDEGDKEVLLTAQREVLSRIVPLHRQIQQEGIVELTTSPYYHPILPLLFDMRSARVALPDLPLPAERFDGSADAKKHLDDAVSSHTRRFGTRPRGLWPSEGSVSPEIVGPVAQAGIQWLASDEDVLALSIGARDGRAGGDRPGPPWLYGPYAVAAGRDGTVKAVFRDHVLSDRIGFQYARYRSGAEAAADLLGRIRSIRAPRGSQPPLVTIIMDGENAWEFYPNQGMEFLTELYGRVCSDATLQAVTISEYLDAYETIGRIERLHSGSWIGANFATWVGQTEKNRGWELLARARAAVEAARDAAPNSLAQAWDAIRRAEGSDWFWWYGEDHSSEQNDLFDQMFRAHLREAYVRAGLAVRDEVEGAIAEERPLFIEPRFLLDVTADGRATSYYEWTGAGYYDTRRDVGAMRPAAGRAVSQLFFGYSPTQFFLRLDPERHSSGAYALDWGVKVVFSNGREVTLPTGAPPDARVPLAVRDAGRPDWRKDAGSAARGTIVELAVPWEDLGLTTGAAVEFYVVVFRGENFIQRLPFDSVISLTVPGENFGAEDWTA